MPWCHLQIGVVTPDQSGQTQKTLLDELDIVQRVSLEKKGSRVAHCPAEDVLVVQTRTLEATRIGSLPDEIRVHVRRRFLLLLKTGDRIVMADYVPSGQRTVTDFGSRSRRRRSGRLTPVDGVAVFLELMDGGLERSRAVRRFVGRRYGALEYHSVVVTGGNRVLGHKGLNTERTRSLDCGRRRQHGSRLTNGLSLYIFTVSVDA